MKKENVTDGMPMSTKRRNKFRNFWVNLKEFYDMDVFRGYIVENMEARISYAILVKIRYNVDEFAMLDQQFSYSYDNYTDDLSFENLRGDIKSRLDISLDKYGLEQSDVLLLQILYREVFYGELETLKIKGVKRKVPKSIYNKISRISPYLPLTFDLVWYGKPLNVISSGEGNTVSSVMTLIKKANQDSYIDFIENFNKNNYLLPDKVKYPGFHSKQLFFQKNVEGIDVIIAIDIISANKYIKKVYSLTGVFLGEVEDIYNGNNIFIRKFGNYIFTIKNNSIVFSEKKIDLPAIKKESSKDSYNIIEDVRIGVIDVETYVINDLGRVYAIGFFTNLDVRPILYYIDKDTLNSDTIILNCINEMLRSKYAGVKFYAHNFGKFDSVFIIKTIYEYNKVINNKYSLEIEKVNKNNLSELEYVNIDDGNPYMLDTICRDDVILKLTIKRKIGKVLHSVTILDSYRILRDTLEKLCLKYGVKVSKGNFPYKFSNKDTLFYVGVTPSINYYKSSISIEVYNNLKKDVWDFKAETLSYLSKDLISLYQILVKVNRALFLDFNVNMTKCLTITKMAYEIFSKHYLNPNKPIPHVIKRDLYKDIKLGYYGGNTEVYIPYGENLYYYDVNSLYPYVSLNDMVGLKCHKQEYIGVKANLDELFGFFYCEVEAPVNKYLGILPVRIDVGIIFPVGKWSGMYFSEELKYAAEEGYKINIQWGYNFNRVSNVFTEYVDNLYIMKSQPKNITQKNLAKSLLNYLYGGFGMDINKPITKIVDNETFNEILLTRKITTKKDITDDDILVTYSSDLDESVCDSFNIDFIEALKNVKTSTNSNTFKNVSVPIAAAVTSYGRIHITKIKDKIIKMGGNIYYSDTDSIVTDIKLPIDMVDPKALGKLKLEYEVKRGYFIGAKTYCLVLNKPIIIEGKEVWEVKIAKGLDSKTLTEQDYVKMYKGGDVKTGIKTYSTTNYFEGSVVVKDEKITLNADSYVKRIKICEDNVWVSTKPLIHNAEGWKAKTI